MSDAVVSDAVVSDVAPPPEVIVPNVVPSLKSFEGTVGSRSISSAIPSPSVSVVITEIETVAGKLVLLVVSDIV